MKALVLAALLLVGCASTSTVAAVRAREAALVVRGAFRPLDLARCVQDSADARLSILWSVVQETRHEPVVSQFARIRKLDNRLRSGHNPDHT